MALGVGTHTQASQITATIRNQASTWFKTLHIKTEIGVLFQISGHKLLYVGEVCSHSYRSLEPFQVEPLK